MRRVPLTALAAAVLLQTSSAFADDDDGFEMSVQFEAEERATEAQSPNALPGQIDEPTSAYFTKVFDDTDRRAFRTLRRLAKTGRHDRSKARTLYKVRAKPVGAIPDGFRWSGFDRIPRMMFADGLRLKRTTRPTWSTLSDAPDASYTKYTRSNAYVRRDDERIRDIYTRDHLVTEERSVYETWYHTLYVYADDGRLDRVYQWSLRQAGQELQRVRIRWSASNEVAGYEVRSAEGTVAFSKTNTYAIAELEARPIALAKK